MAGNIDSGGKGKKGKQKVYNTRVDFTPMVDMNMLLITFFMFCTSLSKPQTMDIVLPTKDVKDLPEENQTKADKDKAITLILAENDKVYYYFGNPNYEDYTSLIEVDYSPDGLRAMLFERNFKAVTKMTELRRKRAKKEITEEQFKEAALEIKKDKDGDMVVIKPTDQSSFRNLVDALDEMQICSIGRYAIVEVADGDLYMLQNYHTKGTFGRDHSAPTE